MPENKLQIDYGNGSLAVSNNTGLLYVMISWQYYWGLRSTQKLWKLMCLQIEDRPQMAHRFLIITIA